MNRTPTTGPDASVSQGTASAEDHSMLVLQPPRCSVFPELPADYYCVDCRCFVSSHGHVRGAHRNHHFLTIREAAELHVPAMKAWASRCETQLQKAESIMDNIGFASHALDRALSEQEGRVEAAYASIVEALTLRKETLKRQLRERVATEQTSATQAWRRMEDLMGYFAAYLEHCAALLVNVPPMEAMDTASVLWSADVMRTSELLASAAQVDDVWLPDLVVPEVGSHCTPETVGELLHLNLRPFTGAAGSSLPTLFDVRPFQLFPDPSPPRRAAQARPSAGAAKGPTASWPQTGNGKSRNDLVDSRLQEDGRNEGAAGETPGKLVVDRASTEARVHSPANAEKHAPAFSIRLVQPLDAAASDTVVLFNRNQSLTRRVRDALTGGRADDVEWDHVLVRGDCQFVSPGLYGWEVHVDRLGGEGEPRAAVESRTGRILAGIAQQDNPDGPGVVWDGDRIVGPTEEQVFEVADPSQVPKAGATLAFLLQIARAGGAKLHCFLNGCAVTSVDLPASSPRPVWCPAVSVLSAADQLTISSLSPEGARRLAAVVVSVPSADAPLRTGTDEQPLQRVEMMPSASAPAVRDREDRHEEDGGQTDTPHRPTKQSALSGSKDEGYSPELREILDYTERMRRSGKNVAWL